MIRLITLQNILSYIEDNLEENLSIEILVQYSGYGRRYLQLLFKKHIDMPLWTYIRYRRITRAAYLIRLTQSTLIDIAIRLRFDSQQTFSREFKKVVGCTPLEYRKKKHWDFVPLLSPKKIEAPHPEPVDICFIDAGCVYGDEFSYEEMLPKNEFANKIRWNKIDQCIAENKSIIWLLTTLITGNKTYESVKILTFIGTESECSKLGIRRCFYNSGSYAHVKFEGSRENYSIFINDIYQITLPYYKLKRDEGVDIENIHRKGENYVCDYYIPIIT